MQLLHDARRWHSEINVSQWPIFEVDRIVEDIAATRLLVLSRDGSAVGAVTIAEEDPLIWTDDVPALYVHRLVVARSLKGQDLGRVMVNLVEDRAIELRKSVLRLDCWANNVRLKNYYERLGFRNIGDITIGSVPSLPKHYQNSTTTRFERPCAQRSVGAISSRSAVTL